MTQIKLDLNPYSVKVLDVVKGMHGLKNRNDAFTKFVDEFGAQYVPKTKKEKLVEHLDMIVKDHVKKYGEKSMTSEELDELLGL